MECEKCQDKGFIEYEHGLVMVFCDCEKGAKKRAEVIGEPVGRVGKLQKGGLGELPETLVIPQGIDEFLLPGGSLALEAMPEVELPIKMIARKHNIPNGEPLHDDNITRTKRANQPARSADTSKPKQPKKRKAKKKAGKGIR